MERIQCEIMGIAPLLFHRFTEAAQGQMEKGITGKKKTKDQHLNEAQDLVYRNDSGEIGVPALNVKKSLLEGCRSATLKMGRKSAEPYMRASVFVDRDFCSLGKTKEDGIHECAGHIPPGKGGKMAIIRRPFVKEGWRLTFGLMVFDERVDFTLVETALREAGKMIGLCDHRPEYGRYEVIRFEPQEGGAS